MTRCATRPRSETSIPCSTAQARTAARSGPLRRERRAGLRAGFERRPRLLPGTLVDAAIHGFRAFSNALRFFRDRSMEYDVPS